MNVGRPEVWIRLPDRDGEPGPLLHIHQDQVVNVRLDTDVDVGFEAGYPMGASWPARLYELELKFTGFELVTSPPEPGVAGHATIVGRVERDDPPPVPIRTDPDIVRRRWEP